jgi:hypothetical protein
VEKSALRRSLAREGALGNLSPAHGAGFGSFSHVRPQRRPLQNVTLREHVLVAASAATRFGHVRFPRAERGAKFVKRAFARDRAAVSSRVLQDKR